MATVVKYITILILAALTLVSCSDGKSLQRYYVDKQDDDRFLKVDLAASLLKSENQVLTDEQQEIMNTIEKVNVVAYPNKGENVADYDSEKAIVKEIIGQEKYKTLMKMGSNKSGASLKYLGEEDAIDEIVIFASDDERGFALFRITGDKMEPAKMMRLMNSVESGDLDISQFNGIGEIFQSM
ncbi:DUF4252 domain-containing protein [Aureitalea marina]|uniref:DUF4252 domain-containing protein n=1 Tax=Aureitalea marina TaxID=930804 RepID=A0A2S7KPM2_9FLAO|nr:DUF4252 domain-containing protein [Aureitalea marina]PQB04572.1 hypothetical protein BST85_06410 [Aureitalea marina]